MGRKILLVEDDSNLSFIIKDKLEERGDFVTLRQDGQSAEEVIYSEKFDILLLDVMLPKKDGFTLAEEIRKNGNDTPIIFMTAREMLEDKARGFKAGADDYITKPFELEELFMRIDAVLNRRSAQDKNAAPLSSEYEIGDFTLLAPELKLIHRNGEITGLTKKEAALLEHLARYANQPLKREEVLLAVWNDDSYFAGRSMDVYITKLRKYLKPDPKIEIQNVHGVGFKLVVS